MHDCTRRKNYNFANSLLRRETRWETYCIDGQDWQALHKAADKVDADALVEKRLDDPEPQAGVTEIRDRFPRELRFGQNKRRLIEAKEYAGFESILHVSGWSFERSKRRISTRSIHNLNKDQTVVNENANKDSDIFNTPAWFDSRIVGNQSDCKCFLSTCVPPKGISTITDLDYSPYTLWPTAVWLILRYVGKWFLRLK